MPGVAGRPGAPRFPTPLFTSLDLITGGKLEEILRYERGVGTADRKIAKVLAEQYGVTLSQITVRNWCDALKIPKPGYVKRSRFNTELPPLPPEALTERIPE